MKGWQCAVIGVVLALSGCGEDDQQQGSGDDERLGGVAQPEAGQSEGASSGQIETLTQDVNFELSVRLNNASQLMVDMSTNLPVGTQLQIIAERDASGVSWRESVVMDENGSVDAGPFGPGSGLPEGEYRIRVSMPPASVQPSAVKARLGPKGEYLSGRWVVQAEHGQGQVVEAQWSLRIEPNGVRMTP